MEPKAASRLAAGIASKTPYSGVALLLWLAGKKIIRLRGNKGLPGFYSVS